MTGRFLFSIACYTTKMMPKLLITTFFAVSILVGFAASSYKAAEKCNDDICKPPDCRCSSTEVPGGLDPKNIPQLVVLTFDDAVTVTNMPFYKKAFEGRKNPDGCPISTTYFVSHEYTDYFHVHQLHAAGHEIALHSITHSPYVTYWKNLSASELVKEFGGERDLISEFANIPKNDITGLRLPLLQMSGDNSFVAMDKVGLEYDCSWPTVNYIQPGIWPYTLDYKSTQDCPIGPCPKESYPGRWVFPMLDLDDFDGFKCSMADSCTNVGTNAEEVYTFMNMNFLRQYNGTRAPFGFYVHASWFLRDEEYFKGYLKFVEEIQKRKDVYIVNIQRALQWVKNPSTIDNLKNTWPECQNTYKPKCSKGKACKLNKGEEIRYMTVCSECPEQYPWLGNPLGK